jgi:hypothetical protein
METISGEKFIEIICSNEAEIISNYLVQIEKPLNIDLVKVNLGITFSNIKFSGKQIKFYKHQKESLHRFTFEQCIFESNIYIESDFEDLSFIANIFNCDKFEISNSEIGALKFNEKANIFNKGNFKIHNCDFNFIFWFKNIQFMENTIIDISSVKFLGGCFFDFTLLNQISFYSCNFFKEFRYDCNYNSSQFRECNFLERTTFLGLFNVDLGNSFLWFDNCSFSKLADLNGYFVHKLRIEDTIFLDNVSLQKVYLNIITIVRTVFEKKVWFENIQINQIENCDIETIRTIKQELQKAENRIDFNRFRNYELIAHYNELSFKNNFKDKFILWATKWSSNYGSWIWAFWFTLIIGFVFFTLFYILENIKLALDLSNWQDFLYGYFRFFLITDFKNEYYEAGESVLKFNCFLSLVPFIIGKIAVAFGIYEMIQSFRKFKA